MTSIRVRPPNNHVATPWREVLLDEVLPSVDAFGGERWPRGEGIIYFNARYYDPIVGRFLTEDLSSKGVNWYAYCANEPINRVDPTGHADAPFRSGIAPGQCQYRKCQRVALTPEPRMELLLALFFPVPLSHILSR
jgi:RHS repeat-associated protein